MACKTEAIPLIFSSNWFLPFCCNFSEKLKHVSFMYCMMGHRTMADCAKVSFRKVKLSNGQSVGFFKFSCFKNPSLYHRQ